MSQAISDIRCSAHDELSDRVARVEGLVQHVVVVVERIDSRIYTEHGEVARQAGAGAAVAKATTAAIALGAAVGALLAGGVAFWAVVH